MGCGLGCSHKMYKGLGLLGLRIALAIVFIYSGWSKLGAYHEMASAGMATIGLPGSGSFWAYFVGILEVTGGLMVLLGTYAVYAAGWLSFIMVVALLTAHRAGPLMSAFPAILALGGSLAILGGGAGKFRLIKCECCCKSCKNGGAGGACGGSCGGKCGCGNKDMAAGGSNCACKNCCGGSCPCGGQNGCACCKK